jgi:hypothetical protein
VAAAMLQIVSGEIFGRPAPNAAKAMEQLSETLRHDGCEILTVSNSVAYIARQLSAQPRRPRGFQLLSEEKTDGRWRGGRPKGAKDRQPRRRQHRGA